MYDFPAKHYIAAPVMPGKMPERPGAEMADLAGRAKIEHYAGDQHDQPGKGQG